jgi:hypothetical protein
MAAGFHRASLSITLDCDWRDCFELDNEDQRRVYWHELVHFWQALSEGFLTRLALLEWQHLNHFDQTGEVAPSSELQAHRVAFFQKDPRVGFSAWNLSESLARFWDIQKMGPGKLLAKKQGVPYVMSFDPRSDEMFQRLEQAGLGSEVTPIDSEEFDYQMQLEDWYAEPYRFVLQRIGSVQTVILFPLVGHFALQSRSPVEVFTMAVHELIGRGLDLFGMLRLMLGTSGFERLFTDRQGKKRLQIEGVWLILSTLVELTCDWIAKRLCEGEGLEPGWVVIEHTELKDQQVYSHILPLLKRVVYLTRQQLVSESLIPPEMPLTFGIAFACPYSAPAYCLLASHFLPPLVMFRDRSWFFWADVWKSGPMNVAAENVGKNSYQVQALQQRHDKASVLASFGICSPKM